MKSGKYADAEKVLRRLGLERRCEEQGDGGKAGRGIHGGLLTYFERYQGNGGQ